MKTQDAESVYKELNECAAKIEKILAPLKNRQDFEIVMMVQVRDAGGTSHIGVARGKTNQLINAVRMMVYKIAVGAKSSTLEN